MQRHLSLISTSEQAMGMQRALGLFKHVPHVLWVTPSNLPVNGSSTCIPANKARTILGREFSLVIFDAWSGLGVNALAAVSGTIRAGGTLVLLTPPLDEWAQYPDPDCQRFLPYPWQPEQVVGHFIRRFVDMLRAVGADSGSSYADTDESSLLIVPESICTTFELQPVQTTTDQQQALASILTADQPLVLNADRGRGKSAVLGMAARRFHADGMSVVLTAPSRAAVSSVLQHAEYPVAFYAPDDLLQSTPQADVLLVDEAAAIPLPMLLQMLAHYPRCVFATTLQGYEGSGRGFVLRFQRKLARLYPDWLEVKLQQPIRWGEGDWLEAFVNQWLIMDDVGKEDRSGLPALKAQLSEILNEIKYQQIQQSVLVNDEPKLREIFHLLVSAHYQTRPSDLRQILDAPHITLHTLEYQQQVVAVALLAREGELEPELVAEIHTGKRRPHGHLLPQSLTFHAGIPGAACLHCERIMRIAVDPAWQRCGLGHFLLGKLRDYAEQQQADYLGVSYALSPEVLAFWEGAGFQSVRLGHRKDKASGSRSLMQVLGLSEQGIALMQQANQQFVAQSNLPAQETGQNITNKKTPSAKR